MGLLWRRRGELHPDQIRAIEGLQVNGRYLIVGPPGSGKTSILLHRGQYLRLPPHGLTNVRLVTFTRTLAEFICVNGDDRFPPELMQTVRCFVDDAIKAHGACPPDIDCKNLAEKNRIRAEFALNVITKSGIRVKFDALLIDEIQDLSPEELRLFSVLSDRLMVVGDSRQRVFDTAGSLDCAKNELGCIEYQLTHHYRISEQICRVADAILVQGEYSLAQFCHYRGPEPTQPVAHPGLSREQQVERLKDALDVQIDTYNADDDLIGVVAWRKSDCEFIFSQLEEDPRFRGRAKVYHSDVDDRSFDPEHTICVTTIQSCKGLEFRALHWLFVDENGGLLTRERAYTAVTRAKTSLALYHRDRLPHALAGAFAPAVDRGLFEDDDE